MDTIACSKEHKDALRKLVPGLKDAPDDEIMSRLAQHHQTMAAVRDRYAGGPSGLATMSRAEIDAKADKAVNDAFEAAKKVPALEAEIQQLSKAAAPVDADMLADRAEIAIGKIDLSIGAGDIPASIGKRLAGAVKSDKGPSVFMLSRHADIGSRPVEFVLDLFKGSGLGVKSGERTGIQTLSRQNPPDDPTQREAYDPAKDPQMELMKKQTAGAR